MKNMGRWVVIFTAGVRREAAYAEKSRRWLKEAAERSGAGSMLIRADNISHSYHTKRREEPVLQKINIQIERGETVGLLGASGSGKSTLGQILCGLIRPEEGEILFKGERLIRPFRGESRKKIQILFQHPESAFNPRLRLGDSLREIGRLYGKNLSKEQMAEDMAVFGIYEEHLCRYPGQLSGGELQRIALARVLLAEPEFLVLDEPTSMLDTISQAQMIHLLMELQKRKGIAYLFITHNRILCERISHRIYMIEQGKIRQKGEEV